MHVANQYAEDVLSGKRPAGELIKLAARRYFSDLDRAKDNGWYFDEKAAEKSIQFAHLLKHYKGLAAGQRVQLLPHQQFQFWNIYGWKNDDGSNRFRKSYEEVARKNGKALDVDTPIPTPDGWKRMGDIVVGDYVIDESGNPTQVIIVSEIQHGRKCYKVTFGDGSEIVADEDHLWFTESINSGRPQAIKKKYWPISYEDKIRTTRQILETLQVRGSRGGKSEFNHKVPLTKAIQLPFVNLLVKPYTLGAWLGDGHSASGRITTHIDDIELMDSIRADGYSLSNPNRNGNCVTLKISNGEGPMKQTLFVKCLKKLGVIGDKHIPSEYLRASHEQRMELLRGLMDTDGTASKAGQCQFTTTSGRLATDVYELITSLGFKTTIRNKQPRINGDATGCAPAFLMEFFAYADTPIFKLTRKRVRQKPKPLTETRNAFRKIISVTPVESRPVKCIGVASKSHLYLAGRSFIPTHNTTGSAIRADKRVLLDEPHGAQVYCAATKENQAHIMTNDAANLLISDSFLRGKVETRLAKELISRVITKEAPYSFIRSIGRDSKTEDGRHASEIKIDEYHAWDSNYLLDVLEQSMKGRKNPLIDITTTAGLPFTGGKDGPCFAFRKVCIDILHGSKKDDALFIMIHNMDDSEKWEDPEQWKLPNPALDAPGCVSMKDLKVEYVAAKNEGAAKEVEFKTKSLNIWTDAPMVWIQDDVWMKSGARPTEWDMFGIGKRAA